MQMHAQIKGAAAKVKVLTASEWVRNVNTKLRGSL